MLSTIGEYLKEIPLFDSQVVEASQLIKSAIRSSQAGEIIEPGKPVYFQRETTTNYANSPSYQTEYQMPATQPVFGFRRYSTNDVQYRTSGAIFSPRQPVTEQQTPTYTNYRAGVTRTVVSPRGASFLNRGGYFLGGRAQTATTGDRIVTRRYI